MQASMATRCYQGCFRRREAVVASSRSKTRQGRGGQHNRDQDVFPTTSRPCSSSFYTQLQSKTTISSATTSPARVSGCRHTRRPRDHFFAPSEQPMASTLWRYCSSGRMYRRTSAGDRLRLRKISTNSATSHPLPTSHAVQMSLYARLFTTTRLQWRMQRA